MDNDLKTNKTKILDDKEMFLSELEKEKEVKGIYGLSHKDIIERAQKFLEDKEFVLKLVELVPFIYTNLTPTYEDDSQVALAAISGCLNNELFVLNRETTPRRCHANRELWLELMPGDDTGNRQVEKMINLICKLTDLPADAKSKRTKVEKRIRTILDKVKNEDIYANIKWSRWHYSKSKQI